MFEKNSLNNINTLIWQELCQIKCTNITIIIAMKPEGAFLKIKKLTLDFFRIYFWCIQFKTFTWFEILFCSHFNF